MGLPLLGVAALGISREEGLLQLSSRVGRAYGLFFTCVLYLTIGPFFAIPRCATVSFTVGIQRLIPAERQPLVLAAFSLAFFAAVLFFSLRPGQILTWIGKLLNPLFLCFLAVLGLRALAAPMGDAAAVEPAGNYAAAPFATGLLEGYNTMDALAGLLSSLLMAVIYLLVTVVGAQSRGQFAAAANGGETFVAIFPGGPSYRVWAAAWRCAACAPAAESRPPAVPCGAAGGFCMLATVMRPR